MYLTKKKKRFIKRVAVASVLGAIVLIISLLEVWMASRDYLMNNDMLDIWTVSSIRTTAEIIERDFAQNGILPKDLSAIAQELKDETFPNSRSYKITRNNQIIDGWGRPLLYNVDETTYTLRSLGRDGKPGGTGFDFDYDQSNWDTVNREYSMYDSNPPKPTLKQFLFELPSKGMLWSCILSGLLAFIMAFLLIRPAESSFKIPFFEIFITLVASLFFAMMIVQLHIPTGH